MEKYYKNNNGSIIIKPLSEIIIIQNGYQIINPPESLLLANGWSKYIEPEIELTFEEIKAKKIEEIIAYDSSDAVNLFYVGGFPIWLDKLTRVGLKGRLDAEKLKGEIYTTLWYEHMQFSLPTDTAMQMLNDVEIYASACYDNTQRHIAAVMQLDNMLAVEQYDYTTGYPEKLSFNENYSL